MLLRAVASRSVSYLKTSTLSRSSQPTSSAVVLSIVVANIADYCSLFRVLKRDRRLMRNEAKRTQFQERQGAEKKNRVILELLVLLTPAQLPSYG